VIVSAVDRPTVDGTARPVAGDYAGLATRTIAFALDAAIINAVIWGVAGAVALGLSLFNTIPHDVKTVLAAIGAGIAAIWTIAYFAFFWSATGQTPGDRVMRIRVQDARVPETIHGSRALLRFGGLVLAVIPLCAGLLLILIDRRRRGLQDIIARTVVVYVPPPESSRRRERQRLPG
jgi:uncharacterized RDD family membrane protein YckC